MDRAIVLIDGEHHPSAVADALRLIVRDFRIVTLAFCGGGEKVPEEVLADPVAHFGYELTRGEDPPTALAAAISEHPADVVVDLADEPMVTADVKLALAAQAESAGLAYLAPGMGLASAPSERVDFDGAQIAVIGTGKRTGKTAVCGHLARVITQRGGSPAVVSMGRGGPPEPIIELPPVDLEKLLALSRRGFHAASDYLEDAVVAGVPTVGCRRVGGGPGGETAFTNFVDGALLAARLDGVDTLLYEGSGAVVPPTHADCTICIVGPGGQGAATGGALRIGLGDLVLTPAGDDEAGLAAREYARGRVLEFEMAPEPIDPVPPGASVAVFTTRAGAPAGIDAVLVSDALARREELRDDLERAFALGCNHVLTEIKAAAIDTVAEAALAAGASVGFIRNRPLAAGRDVEADLDEILFNIWQEAAL